MRTPASALPDYVERHSHWIIEVPVRIVVIIIVAWLVRLVAHRLIDRAVRPAPGRLPRILRPLRERVENLPFLEGTGLLSERRAQRATTIGSLLKSIVSVTIFVIAFLLVLSELDVNLAPLIAGTSIVGIALAFGAQSIVKDFLSGLFMMLEDQYGVGDVIDFEKATGVVEAVGLRTTRLRDSNGTVWYVRNGEVLRVGNQSQGFAQVVLDIAIAASVDVDAASAALLEVGTQMRADEEWAPVFLDDPQVLGVESMTRYETVLRLIAKVRPLEQWRTARELRRRIHQRLEQLTSPTE